MPSRIATARHLRSLLLPTGTLVTLLLLSAGVALSGERVDDPPAQSASDDVITFTRDIAPILQENCQLCHQPGSIGPMSLMTFEEVAPWAPLIKQEVLAQRMPPYHYDVNVGIQELKDDMRLTQTEIRTIVAWVDAGAPMGDLADMPPPVQWPDASAFRYASMFGPPDLIVRSDPYTVPADGQDLWWRPLVPAGLEVDRYIRAIETKPSVAGRAVAHHANSSFRVPNQDGRLVAGPRLSEYALGKVGEIVPEGAGRVLPANSMVAWDIHYYPMGEVVEDDVVEIGIWLYPEDYVPEFRQTLALYGLNGDILLPPHGTAMTQGFHSFDHPVRIDSFQPHGHLRLVAKSLEVFYPETGRREMVSMISNWNPGWHLSHIYEDHVAPLVPAGAVLVITAWYDNSENNPYNPDPEVWVGRGSRTGDEMSHAWIAITHLDQEGYERLLAERQAQRRVAEEEDR